LCAETIHCIKFNWTIYCPDHLNDAPAEALEQQNKNEGEGDAEVDEE
jgi:hypothetical protein